MNLYGDDSIGTGALQHPRKEASTDSFSSPTLPFVLSCAGIVRRYRCDVLSVGERRCLNGMQQHDETIVDTFVVLFSDHALKNINIVPSDIGFDLNFSFTAGKPGFSCWQKGHAQMLGNGLCH